MSDISSNVACISDVRRIYNVLYSQICLIWAEGLQDPNQIYSSCTTRARGGTVTPTTSSENAMWSRNEVE